MKISTFEKGIPMLPRVGACLAAIVGALILGAACNQAGEGDRCNPLRSSDECGSGLVCSGNPVGLSAAHPIAFCPENYCCPVNVTPSDNPYCQPGCNGGAASICAAEGADAAACAFASCAADAANPATCTGTSEEDAGASDASDASPSADAMSSTDAGDAGLSADVASDTGPSVDASDASSEADVVTDTGATADANDAANAD
jgi:hypothetical protein